MSPADLLDHWRQGRAELLAAAATLADDTRFTWYGPSMGARSFLTARLMETWAHGQDVVDAVGADRPATDRLVHIAQMGVITRSWSYLNRGESGTRGPGARRADRSVGGRAPLGATPTPQASITVPMLDFCLVVTQRRNVAGTDLVVVGEHAEGWMRRAQAFAGPPTEVQPAEPGCARASGFVHPDPRCADGTTDGPAHRPPRPARPPPAPSRRPSWPSWPRRCRTRCC